MVAGPSGWAVWVAVWLFAQSGPTRTGLERALLVASVMAGGWAVVDVLLLQWLGSAAVWAAVAVVAHVARRVLEAARYVRAGADERIRR